MPTAPFRPAGLAHHASDQFLMNSIEHEQAMRRAWGVFAMALLTAVAAFIAAA